MTKEETLVIIKNYWKASDEMKEVKELAKQIFYEIEEIGLTGIKGYRGCKFNKNDYASVDILVGEENVSVRWEEYHCGETENYDTDFPTDYLFDVDWKVKEIEKRRIAVEHARQEAEEREKQQKAKDIEAKRKLYESLKKEFE